MKRFHVLISLLPALGLAGFLACSSSSHDSTPPPSGGGSWSSGGSTSLKGTMAGANESGILDWSVGATFTPSKAQGPLVPAVLPAAASSVAINGTATIAGEVVTITGTFDAANPTASGSVQASGTTVGSIVYTFTGSAVGGKLVGTYGTSAGGAGNWSILFVPSGGSVEIYTGSYANGDGSDQGYFNIEISSGGSVSANYASTVDGSSHGQVIGTVSAVATSSTAGAFGGDIYDKNGTKIGTITAGHYTLGSNHTGNVNGTYSVGSPAVAGGFDGNN